MENDADWWTRITVQLHKDKQEESDEAEYALRFACSTGSAREEERDLQTSPEIINELIEEMKYSIEVFEYNEELILKE